MELVPEVPPGTVLLQQSSDIFGLNIRSFVCVCVLSDVKRCPIDNVPEHGPKAEPEPEMSGVI